MRLCVAYPAARAGVSSGGREHPQVASAPAHCPGCPRPCSGAHRNAGFVRPPSGLPEETRFHLSASTCSFFFTSQTTRGAGSHKRPWFGTLPESLAGRDGRKRRDRVPWNAAFRSHHRRETGCIRGCGAGTQASSFSHSPAHSTHTYTLRSRTPSSPPESPQPRGGEPGESSVRSARGPGMETQPVQAGPFGPLRACSGGGQLPLPAGAPWYPGTLHNNPAGSSGQEKGVPLQASDTSQGNGGKTSEAADGADLEEASETSEGRPRLRRRTSGFLGADRREGRHSHPPGQRLFFGTKGPQGLTGHRDEHPGTDLPPAPAPQAASGALFPQEGRSCPFIHTGDESQSLLCSTCSESSSDQPQPLGDGDQGGPCCPASEAPLPTR